MATSLAERRSDDLYVFAKPASWLFQTDFTIQTFRRAVAEPGILRICVHDLDTRVSILPQQTVGTAEAVSERLGHNGVAFTMTV